MMGFMDVHQHVLYGVDDGAKTPDVMEKMLIASCEDGVTCLVATPHITPGVKMIDAQLLASRMDEANAIIARNGLNLRLLQGAENLYTPMLVNAVMNHTLLTLGETNRVLVEFMPSVLFEELERAASQLTDNGYSPVFAHVERYDCLRRSPSKAARLKEQYGLLYQMNGNTVVNHSGGLGGLRVRQLLKNGLIDLVATDAHNLSSRRTCMTNAYQTLCTLVGKDKAEKLCCGAALR